MWASRPIAPIMGETLCKQTYKSSFGWLCSPLVEGHTENEERQRIDSYTVTLWGNLGGLLWTGQKPFYQTHIVQCYKNISKFIFLTLFEYIIIYRKGKPLKLNTVNEKQDGPHEYLQSCCFAVTELRITVIELKILINGNHVLYIILNE